MHSHRYPRKSIESLKASVCLHLASCPALLNSCSDEGFTRLTSHDRERRLASFLASSGCFTPRQRPKYSTPRYQILYATVEPIHR